MMTLVIYDISDDKTRGKVASTCKRFGLNRIQKSAFLGEITSSRRKEMIEVLRRLIRGENGNIQVFVICKPDLTLRTIIGDFVESETGETLFF